MVLPDILNPDYQRARGDAARDAGDWLAAAKCYSRYLRFRRRDAGIWVQLGNVLKECGRFQQSERAYLRAMRLGLDDSDLHLQLGHLSKVRGQAGSARHHYLTAIRRQPMSVDAFEELVKMGLEAEANTILLTERKTGEEPGEMLIFDVSDLIYYVGHHDNLSGIQRVQCCIIQAIVKYGLKPLDQIGFISFNRRSNGFMMLDRTRFLAWLDDLSLPPEQRCVPFDVAEAREGRIFPMGPLAAFIQPERTTLVLLGAAWVTPDYPTKIANLKRLFSARFVMVFHDFIPIFAKETCDQRTAEVFKEFIDQILPITDVALCVSRNTRDDLHRYCANAGICAPPALVTRLGSGFHEFFPEVSDRSALPVPAGRRGTPYVLFVSTIEGRKNHQYLFDVWDELARRGVDTPRILCVGRLGWRAEPAIIKLIETDYLGGKVEIREDVSDIELKALYEGALFTVYPSIYEGWGLPVSESLANGKVCVLADRTSLPEVAGEFGVYVPLDDPAAAADVVAELLSRPGELARREEAIREKFQHTSWRIVAEVALQGCTLARTNPVRSALPTVRAAVEYPVRSLRMSTQGLMGSAMMDALEQAHAALILPGSVKSAHKVSGLLCRNSDWYAPEDWGSWARARKARVQFAVEASEFDGEDEVLIYLALRFLEPALPATVRITLSGCGRSHRQQVRTEEAMMVWPVHARDFGSAIASDSDRLALELQLEIVGMDASVEAACRTMDSRELVFGLRSFCIVKGSDTVQRLRIAERQGYRSTVGMGEA